MRQRSRLTLRPHLHNVLTQREESDACYKNWHDNHHDRHRRDRVRSPVRYLLSFTARSFSVVAVVAVTHVTHEMRNYRREFGVAGTVDETIADKECPIGNREGAGVRKFEHHGFAV